jgi:hypothetical protein
VADELHRYPDGAAAELRNAIARKYGLNADRIVCGCGSDELINLIAHAYIGPGDEAIYTEHGFSCTRSPRCRAAAPVMVPEKAYRTDVDAILARGPRTKVVFSPIQQPDRHLHPPRRGAPPARACRARRCWCSMPPTASTCAATTTGGFGAGRHHRTTR